MWAAVFSMNSDGPNVLKRKPVAEEIFKPICLCE